MRVFKNLFGDGSKIHAGEIAVGSKNKNNLLPSELKKIEGKLEAHTEGNVINIINDYISQGHNSGRVLFAGSVVNLPVAFNNLAFVEFYTFPASSHVYLKAYNFQETGRLYYGRILGTSIVWRYVAMTLA